jgi:hypothetical protein
LIFVDTNSLLTSLLRTISEGRESSMKSRVLEKMPSTGEAGTVYYGVNKSTRYLERNSESSSDVLFPKFVNK